MNTFYLGKYIMTNVGFISKVENYGNLSKIYVQVFGILNYGLPTAEHMSVLQNSAPRLAAAVRIPAH